MDTNIDGEIAEGQIAHKAGCAGDGEQPKSEGWGTDPDDGVDIDNEEDDLSYELPQDLYSVFFPRWALAKTTEAKIYRSLYAEIAIEAQPQSIFEEMEVAEITNAFWEQQQIQTSLADIVKSNRRTALASMLAPIFDHDHSRAVEAAGEYFSGDPEKRKTVEGLLHAHGIEPAAISSEAIAHRSLVLEVLNRTATKLGIRRDQIVAEIGHRRQLRRGRKLKLN